MCETNILRKDAKKNYPKLENQAKKAEQDLSISCGGIIQQATQRLSRGLNLLLIIQLEPKH